MYVPCRLIPLLHTGRIDGQYPGTLRGQTVRDFLCLGSRLALAIVAMRHNNAHVTRHIGRPQSAADRKSGPKVKANRGNGRQDALERSTVRLQTNRTLSKIPCQLLGQEGTVLNGHRRLCQATTSD